MKKILDLLGLCARAGSVRSGEEFSLKAIKGGTAKLAMVDGGASEKAKEMFESACKRYEVPIIYTPEGKLGAAIGKTGRMALVITDHGFADSMIRIYHSIQDR